MAYRVLRLRVNSAIADRVGIDTKAGFGGLEARNQKSSFSTNGHPVGLKGFRHC